MSTHFYYCSVIKSCLTPCDPMNCSSPGFPSFTISQSLLKLMSIESVMPCNHLILCYPFSSCLQSFPASGSFPMSQLFISGGQSVGASASASVLPMNIQGWYPQDWPVWSLCCPRDSQEFSPAPSALKACMYSKIKQNKCWTKQLWIIHGSNKK